MQYLQILLTTQASLYFSWLLRFSYIRALTTRGLIALILISGCASSPLIYRTPITVPEIQRPAGESPSWWFRAGAASAAHAIAGTTAKGHAKNIILFLGDGMSLTTIAAAHILAGQRLGLDGESYRLSFEKFPYTALSRTYEIDEQTPDSAGTMTAIMSGVKTKSGLIGLNQQAKRKICQTTRNSQVISALELAKAASLSVGIVTTTRLTHATPAATYGHVPERNWETDSAVSQDALQQGCTDLAQQLINFPVGDGINVAFGGGRTKFMPNTLSDPEYPKKFGERRDGRNLITQWQRQHPQGIYVWNTTQLKNLTSAFSGSVPSHVLALFEPSHMRYEHERMQDIAGEPSLAEMTEVAIRLLNRNSDGYFLVVEGGRIDHALHSGNAYRALDETISFAAAVQVAVDLTSQEDTLLIVTADHSHTLNFSGYPQRGNPILGLTRNAASEDDEKKPHTDLLVDALGLPYTTLGFANGPGYTGASEQQPEGSKWYPHKGKVYQAIKQGRPDLSKTDTQHPDYLQEASVPMLPETHAGEDVLIFAHGPGAAAFHGELEQNVIFHLMVQLNPAMRTTLCSLDICNADGIPINLPDYSLFKQRYFSYSFK